MSYWCRKIVAGAIAMLLYFWGSDMCLAQDNSIISGLEILGFWNQALEEAVAGVEEPTFPGFVGVIDVVYGSSETSRFNTITGSDKVLFQFPCIVDCAYIELAGDTYGKQWISGKYQKVFGGSGALGALYDYEEPTGRFPLGPAFKIVLWEVDESKGSAEFRAFTKVCSGLAGCTPYVLPPGGIPLTTLYEKDSIFVGLLEPEIPVSQSQNIPDLESESSSKTEPEETENEELVCEGYQNPAPGYSVSSEYGTRVHPITGTLRFHSGIDVATPEGVSVRASDNGTVAFTGGDSSSGYGYHIILNHCNGEQTLYGHLNNISVTFGQRVGRGQPIGSSGNTGASTGPHLHFEVIQGGNKVNPRQSVNF